MDLIQTWSDDRYYCTLHFDASLIDRGLDSSSQEFETANILAPVTSQMEFGILLSLVGSINLILILFRLFNIQGREPYLQNKKL